MEQTFNQLHAEQAAIGELPPELQDQYRFNQAFQKKVRELKQQNLDFLLEFPADMVLPNIESRTRKFTPTNRFNPFGSPGQRRTLYGLGLAAAALLVVIMLPVLITTFPGGSLVGDPGILGEDVIRLKGLEPQLQVFRYRPGLEEGYELLSPNDRVLTRDRLQVSLNPAGYSHGAVFSVDGRGVITLHFPSNFGASTSVGSQGTIVLPYAYELDDAPLFERFILILSHSPVDLRGLAGTIQAQLDRRSWVQDGVLELPNQYQVVYLPLRK